MAPYKLQQEYLDMAKRPNAEGLLGGGSGIGPSYGEAGKMFPQLCSWLCDTAYEDGTVKGRTQLQVERKGDRVRVLLKVADSGLCVEASHESLSDAVLTLELLLGNDDCPWQLDPFPFSSHKKKGRN